MLTVGIDKLVVCLKPEIPVVFAIKMDILACLQNPSAFNMSTIQCVCISPGDQSNSSLIAHLNQFIVVVLLFLINMMTDLQKSPMLIFRQELKEFVFNPLFSLTENPTDTCRCNDDVVRRIEQFLKRDSWHIIEMVVIPVKALGDHPV